MRLSFVLSFYLIFKSSCCGWELNFDAQHIGRECTHKKSGEKGQFTYEKDCHEAIYLNQNGRSGEVKSYGFVSNFGRVVCCVPKVKLASVAQAFVKIQNKYVSREKCGSYCFQSDVNIEGGTPAEKGEFPHMAAVGYYNAERNMSDFDCGGTLISEKFVMTAAHCANKKNRVPYLVRLGKTSLNLNDINDPGIAFESFVKNVYLAKEYSSMSKQHDIALLELERPVPFSEEVCKRIQPACLPNTNEIEESGNREFTVIGFGKTQNNAAKSDWLMKAKVQEFSRSDCVEKFKHIATIYGSQICAHDPEGLVDTCEGDSGSSLQIRYTVLNLYYIHGITSYGLPCGSAFPAIYTRVASYIPWIESIVWP